jgi:transcriptional regulator with XRE-family HTH domain
MTFADKLRELRERAGLTQLQLAKAAEVPIGSIRNYEQGHREPLWDVLFKLASALGTDCSVFAECVGGLPSGKRASSRSRKRK